MQKQELLSSVMERHDRPCLQFSGGKDSLACLELLKPWWGKLLLAWTNTGDAYPETISIVNYVKWLAAGFIEIKSDVRTWINQNGWPVDLVPVRNTPFGISVTGDAVALQPYPACCAANIWVPMHGAMKEYGVTLIIRGQRISDNRKSQVRSGCVIDGIEYLFPLEDWSASDVFEFLANCDIGVPDYYENSDTSLDCMHCTAYLDESGKKMRWLGVAYPDVAQEVSSRLTTIRHECARDMRLINSSLRSANAVNYGEI